MNRLHWRPLVLLAFALLAVARPLPAAPPPAADKQKIAALPAQYQRWLEEVDVLIRPDEKRLFLELEKDYQRDAFIERFWKSRDDAPETERSEFKARFYDRLEIARERYKADDDDRFRTLLLNGEPHDTLETDCGLILWPVELWSYNYSDTLKRPFALLFYQRGAGGPFRLWLPSQGFADLVALGSAEFEAIQGAQMEDFIIARYLDERCIDPRTDDLIYGIQAVKSDGPAGAVAALRSAPPRDAEWLETFQHFSTDLPAEASTLDARFAVSFPGTHQSRTVVQGLLAVPAEQASVVEIEGYRAYNLQLTGEVLRGEELFESFRYRFDLPAAEVTDGELPLFFERYLRPGGYRFVLKLEDLNAHSFHRHVVEVEVPSLHAEAAAAEPGVEEESEIGPAVELVEPPDVILTGSVRFEAVVRGDGVRKVAFALDDKALLTKTRPPYSVDVSLGSVPRTHTLTAVAYDDAGREVARDDLLVNAGQHHFAVEIVEPRGTVPPGTVRVRAEVAVPEGAAVERVELYRDDLRLATLYSPPYVQPLTIGADEIVVLRAAAFLNDGNSTEDVVLLNAPGMTEETDVRLVELFTTVIGQDGRPRQGLARDAFTVYENGVEQEVLRFDRLDDLPIHAALLIDTSASMQKNLDEVNQAALRFLRSTITPKDRAAIITFSEQPFLAAPLTHDMQELSRALAGLKAERSTALYDSIVFSLFYLKGLTGQRALLVLSDGEDRLSEHSFSETLELAAREGVTIYAVGIELRKLSEGRRRLTRLAEETGGRSFFIKSMAELDAIYDAIQEELRSQYLLAYQSSHGRGDDDFRVIEVKVSSGGEARTLRGYYP